MPDDDYFDCEECRRPFLQGPTWGYRICAICMGKIRRDVGMPAIDCDLTPEEQEYLEQTFGAKLPESAEFGIFCHSCVKHGADRLSYPCLRRDACGWDRQRRASWVTNVSTSNSIYYTSSQTTTSNVYTWYDRRQG